jgi:molybdate transport system substrate-binding protein
VRRMALAVALAAAVGASAAVPAHADAPDQSAVRGSLTVFAASSLTEAFTAIGKSFERRYPRAHVTFSFNASSTLVTQIEQGAPADVFASADTATMQQLLDGGRVADHGSLVFTKNRLEIAVERGNPRHIRTLADTVKSGTTLVLCAPEVPCGKFARQAYAKAKVHLPDVPTGANVKDTLTKVTLGEADAAVVYITDVRAAKGSITGVKIPDTQNVVATYPIAPIVGASNPVTAKAFALYVDSSADQRILRRFGFLPR